MSKRRYKHNADISEILWNLSICRYKMSGKNTMFIHDVASLSHWKIDLWLFWLLFVFINNEIFLIGMLSSFRNLPWQYASLHLCYLFLLNKHPTQIGFYNKSSNYLTFEKSKPDVYHYISLPESRKF